ncbi:hypothetical protein HPO96_04255 [Kribbella sandramycini]|uniref:Cytochrome bd-type quinol oxidase subunit 1 n=1 Tax=Kribbella sandramycini TaxID=60450 RepID=A0A7Y4NY46_9ACTN|nr:hypothetical protein [Kribbella sandramycini]MBB6567952.1 cytochrome bd-type quinol oxidase subunit 1 [Kribbella sandramycini]NOL39453.1 hypothetical protein [Kribbella sandramycini]
MNAHPATRPRGSLLGLALAVGMFAFFIADGSNADGPAAFVIAIAVVLTLFLLAVAAATARRRALEAPAPEEREYRPRSLAAVPGARSVKVPWRRSQTDDDFLRVTDAFLAAMSAAPASEQRSAERLLLSVMSDPKQRVAHHEAQIPELAGVVTAVRNASSVQLGYFRAVLEARQALR